MRSECFGAERERDPDFYNKYYTPEGKPRWDVMMADLQPASPEFCERLRLAAVHWLEEKERRQKRDREDREEREREQNHNTQSNQPINDKPS